MFVGEARSPSALLHLQFGSIRTSIDGFVVRRDEYRTVRPHDRGMIETEAEIALADEPFCGRSATAVM
jgi:hypothetical protein